MKLLCIGLSRTGTASLYNALKHLGYNAAHWPKSMREIAAHEACCDITVSSRFETLHLMYPDARFIYTVRNASPWVKSCLKHFQRTDNFSDLAPEQAEFVRQSELDLLGSLGPKTETELLAAHA